MVGVHRICSVCARTGFSLADGDRAGLIPSGSGFHFLYGAVMSAVILIVCLVGAGLFAKASVVIMIGLAICYASFLLSFAIVGVPYPVRDS
jgi:hypothetical protein